MFEVHLLFTEVLTTDTYQALSLMSPCDSQLIFAFQLVDVEYFSIINHYSGKALTASLTNVGVIVMWTYHGNDNQLWFWDGAHVLRNKMFPKKVMLLNASRK